MIITCIFCLFYVSQFFVLFFPSCVTIYVIIFVPAVRLFLVFHCSRSVLYCFPTFFFIISLCVVSLFCVCFSVSQCKFPISFNAHFPPHSFTKYTLESMFTPKRTKYPKHYAKNNKNSFNKHVKP